MNLLPPAARAENATWIKWIPLTFLLLLIALGFLFRQQLSVGFLVAQMTSHPSLAALFLLSLYLIKSLSMGLPVVLLYISSGLVFGPAEAIALNLLGLWIASTLPFCWGRFCGSGLANKIYLRYPRSRSLLDLPTQNCMLLAFVLRMCGVVPMELGSMFMGALYPAYGPFILGSMLGLLPKMLAYTFLGSSIYDPASPGFALTLVASLLVTIGSGLLYHFYLRCAAEGELQNGANGISQSYTQKA